MIIMPLVVNFALSYLHSEIYGDVMLESVSNVLSVAIDILSSLTYILTIGLLINSLLRNSNIAVILYLISTALIYGLGLIVTGLTSSGMLPGHFLYIIPSVVADILVLFAVIFICKRKFSLKKCILLSVSVIFAVGFINNLIETIILFTNYGFPSNASEFLFITEPYIGLIIYSFVGYFTIFLLSNLLKKSKA